MFKNYSIKLVSILVLSMCFFDLKAQHWGQIRQKAQQGQKKNILLGRATLPAASFAKGPTSGQFIGQGPINNQSVPFINKQPIQGFSSVLYNGDGTFWALSDNGFGSMPNSADYHLRIYKIRPNFKTAWGGNGAIRVEKFIELRDPQRLIPFPVTNHFTRKRVLTGADFDIESFQFAPDGTLWVGDEFGPFLLHFSARGVLLEAPIALPDFEGKEKGQEIRSPQNPDNEEAATLRIMNAVRTHARINGSQKTPVFSPWFVMLKDDNPATFAGSRTEATALQLGLKPASSEIHDVKSLQQAGFPVVPYTINDADNMHKLIKLGVDGIISDSPDILLQVARTYDGDKDGKPDFVDENGLLDIKKFDAQGHRGARNLRPENTLPSMEAALDYLMTTLETDCGVTKDGKAILAHDPRIEAARARRTDGTHYDEEDEVLIKDLTLKEIQTQFIADKLTASRPNQTNDLALSPVSVAFAKFYGLKNPYVYPSLQQLFLFVRFYKYYYLFGPGKHHPEAKLRWINAAKVRFNVETKINPRTDVDSRGMVFAKRTVSPRKFTQAVARPIIWHGLSNRADIQSFDFRTLLQVHKRYPSIRTVFLFGDFPKTTVNGQISGDGTNMQDQNGKNTPWMAGLLWPYRSTMLNNPTKVARSGGFEGLALTPDGKSLLPLLEKPLVGSPNRALLIHEFDLASKKYTGKRYTYPLDEKASAIGDFIMYSKRKGLIIERDGTQGDLNGFKRVFEVTLKEDGTVNKTSKVDLLKLMDPAKISFPGKPGDIGVGSSFAFPFVTIESVVVLDPFTIGILNDNNYPFSKGRNQNLVDDNEFILIYLDTPLYQKENEVFTNNSGQVSNYPNPFMNKTTIRYELPIAGNAQITIKDAQGNLIKNWTKKQARAGKHEVVWNGKNNRGKTMHLGVYICTISVGDVQMTRRLIKLR